MAPGGGVSATSIGGFADPAFGELADLFRARLADGAELGASVAVSIDGALPVDLWGGWADENRTRPWGENTLVNTYSVNKTMLAITALYLADKRVIDFDAPVAKYWPEFAQAGKGGIEVRHLMSHAAGLSGWKTPLETADIYDWDKLTTLLAAQEPFWAPGTASGYHGYTQGILVGEVVRRATGEMLADIFRREIAEPLGADYHLTLEADDDDRVADLAPPQMDPAAAAARSTPSALMINVQTNPPMSVEMTRTRQWRAAHFYAAAGHGNGRSIAKVHALIANGGEVNGKRVMSEAGCRKALELQIEGHDLCLSMQARFGMGFGLPGQWLQAPHSECLFWPGAGGALAVIDMKSRMSFGYAMNKMQLGLLVDRRPLGLLNAAWGAVAS